MATINYQVIHKQSGAKMLFSFDENGYCIAHQSECKMTDLTVDFYKIRFPWKIGNLVYYRQNKQFSVDIIKQDLSFATFWNTYSNKVGNKRRAEKLWEALSVNDKAKAMSYIVKYDNYLIGAMGVQKLYPETYLYQRRFDND